MSETKTNDQNEKVEKPTLEDVPNMSEITEDDDNSSYGRDKKKRRRKKKIVLKLKCPLCESGVKRVTYKDVYQLKKFTSVRGKIISTEKSGVCHKHQNQIKRAIKRARYLALLPYVSKDN